MTDSKDSIEDTVSECKSVSNVEELKDVWPDVLETLNETEGSVEQTKIIEASIKSFAKVLTESGNSSYEILSDNFIGEMADASLMTKTKLNELLAKKKEEVRVEEMDDDAIMIDDLINKELEYVEKQKNTDSNIEPSYKWVFSDGTTLSTNAEHKNEHTFAEKLFEALDRKVEATDDDFQWWNGFLKQWMIDNQQIDTHRGPRTKSIENLKQIIENRPATTNKTESITQAIPYVEEPEATVLHVPNTIIKESIRPYEVEARALREELPIHDAMAGETYSTTTADGRNARMWKLERNWAEPSEVKGGDDA